VLVFETGAPPPPTDLPVAELVQPPEHQQPEDVRVVATAAVGFDATSVVLPAGPPPGTQTYRLRGTETSQDG
jgi:hypothetical protein